LRSGSPGGAVAGFSEMAGKSFTVSREGLKPDLRYNSLLVEKFINCMML
jgi:hypothetical protein